MPKSSPDDEHRRRADPAHPRRHRGAPPLSQRARHAEHAARARRVPVINENDTVATAEIRFGDNDRLAARVASMMGADRLVLLSDVDGLYTADPTRDADAQHIAEVEAITPEIEAMAGGSVSGVGRGGMASKLIAAKIATAAGCEVIIAKGKTAPSARRDARRRARTRASSPRPRPPPRASAGSPAGSSRKARCIIDAGAPSRAGSGQEPAAGRRPQVDGTFRARRCGARLRDREGREIARGLAAYGAADATRIAGKRSARNRGHPGLSWPRRDDPSRRSGADGTATKCEARMSRSCRRDGRASARPRMRRPRVPARGIDRRQEHALMEAAAGDPRP